MKGTCLEMCPTRERIMREKEDMLHVLELPPGTSFKPPPTSDPSLTVKSYIRSAAGQQTPLPKDVRPLEVLLKTVKHLLASSQVQRPDESWCVIYDFVWDRLRAVRQDMVIQGLKCSRCIKIYERIVRFHCYAGYRLCDEPICRFDSQINSSQLLACLKQVLVLYDDLDYHGKSRYEMEALYLLWGLGDAETLTRGLHLPSDVQRNETVKQAFAMSRAMWCGNYVYVCSSVKALPPLLLCAAVQQLPRVRRRALHVMSHGYHSRNLTFPLQHLSKLLLYQTEKQTITDCDSCGQCVRDGGIEFNRTCFKSDAKMACWKLTCVDKALKSVGMSCLLLHPHVL